MKSSHQIRQPTLSATPIAKAHEMLSPLAARTLAVALAAVVFAVYRPALNFQFILDDHRFVADPRVQSPGHVWEYFTSYVWAQVTGGPLSFYRPLFLLWMRLNFIVCGDSPWGWHLLSVGKHVTVAALLGLLAWRLLRDRRAALMAGTLFALHPAHTESVAWVTVPDPLMSACVLGTLLLYLKYADRASARARTEPGKSHRKSRKVRDSGTRPPARWIIASTVASLAALMAKETAIILPVVVFVLALLSPACVDREQADRQGSPEIRPRLWSGFRETLPFLGVTVFYLLLRLNALGSAISPPTQHLPLKTVLLSWPATLWFYVKVLFWPVRPRAFADPSLADTLSLRGVVLPGLGVLCLVAILAGLCLMAWRKARNLPDREAVGIERALLLGSLLLALPLLLALNLNALNPGDFLHGRYTYLPLCGLMLLLATGWHLAPKGRIALLSAAGIVAVGFSVLTVMQESGWKDDLTVFTVAHESAPHNEPVALNLTRAHVQVALGLDEEDRCDEAMPIFNQAIQQYPQDWYAWAGRGECLVKLNDLAGAEQALRRASELSGEPRVLEQWQEVRTMMGLGPAGEQPRR